MSAPNIRMSRLPSSAQSLRSFLRDAPELAKGAFNHKVPPVADIRTLTLVLKIVETAIGVRDWARADDALDQVSGFGDLLDHARYAGHGPHLRALRAAIAEHRIDKATRAFARLTRIVRVVAADRIIPDGHLVRVIRTQHGWYDGTVVGRFRRRGTRMLVTDEGGDTYEIEHQRDVRPA